jgi:hypothetical protein
MSQISFGVEGSISPKKPTSLHEVAKQKELTGTLEAAVEDNTPSRKPTSTAKVKELVGSNIFGPPPPNAAIDVQPKSLMRSLDSADIATQDNSSTPLKVNPFVKFLILVFS